jgi:hypothetical protein
MLVGDRVKVTGLVDSPQYNELEGEVSGIEPIQVIMDIGITLAVKQENLVLVKTGRPIFDQNEIVFPHILPKHLLKHLGFAGSDGWRMLEEKEQDIICCQCLNSQDDSTLRTYGCFGTSSRHYINDQSVVNVFDISFFFPCSALAGAVLKDPVAIDYYSERYFLLSSLSENGHNDFAKALRMAPQFYELKMNPGEFSVGDACKKFESPSPQFQDLYQRLAGSHRTTNVEHDDIKVFVRDMFSCSICILFTVGPVFNKLFINDRRVNRSQLGSPSDSEVTLIRECAIRLAQKRARMLKRWISNVQPKVNTRSRDWIQALESSVLLQGDVSDFVQFVSDQRLCRKMMQGTDLRWARCTTEEIAATSRLLAPVNRMRMCTTEYSPTYLKGQRSAYQSLLLYQMLPEHECVEVTLRERVAANVRAISSQPLASASPEERSGGTLDCIPQRERTLDCLSLLGLHPAERENPRLSLPILRWGGRRLAGRGRGAPSRPLGSCAL